MKKSLTVFQAEQLPRLEQVMLDFLRDVTTDKRLCESMSYSVQAGGKRIRPLLILAAVDFCGSELTESVYRVAASLELIHTYSLIHDDLPAMDNDDYRRGKLTNHKVFGEGMAILAGDGLLTSGFQLLSQSELPSALCVLLMQKLSQAAGSGGMVAGQAADIIGEGKKLSLTELQQIHTRKTGALIQYGAEAGALIAGAEEEVVTSLSLFGKHVGVAFQIRDDLLDILGSAKELGKAVGKDADHHKNTYPALLGVEGAQKALVNEISEARITLNRARKLLGRDQHEYLDELLINIEKV